MSPAAISTVCPVSAAVGAGRGPVAAVDGIAVGLGEATADGGVAGAWCVAFGGGDVSRVPQAARTVATRRSAAN